MRGRLSILLVAGAALVVAGIPRAAQADPHAFFYTAIGQRQLFFNVLAALDQADYVEPKEDIFETGIDVPDARQELLEKRTKEIEKSLFGDPGDPNANPPVEPTEADINEDGDPIDPGELDLITEATETNLSTILARNVTLEGNDLFTAYLLHNLSREASRRDDLREVLEVMCRRGLGAGKENCGDDEVPDPVQAAREKKIAHAVNPMKELVESQYFALVGATLSNVLPNPNVPFFDVVKGVLGTYPGDDQVRRLILSLGTKWDDGNPENKYRLGGPYGYAVGLGSRYLNAAGVTIQKQAQAPGSPATAHAAAGNTLQRQLAAEQADMLQAVTGNEVADPDLFSHLQFREREDNTLEASCSATFEPSSPEQAFAYIKRCGTVLQRLAARQYQEFMELRKEGNRLADNFDRLFSDFPNRNDYKLATATNADGNAAGAVAGAFAPPGFNVANAQNAAGQRKPGGIYIELTNNIDKGPGEIPKVYSPGESYYPNIQESPGEPESPGPSSPGSGTGTNPGGTPLVQGTTTGQVLSAFNPSPGLGVQPLRELEPFRTIYETTIDPSDYDQSEYSSSYGGSVSGAQDGTVAGTIDYAIQAALPRLQ